MGFERHHELQLLEALEAEPETTQADPSAGSGQALAARVGVAVGTVNWYLKRWAAKGYVKVKRIGRWRWRYLLTPQGMAEKARLAAEFMEASLAVYRRTRAEAKDPLGQVHGTGYDQVAIDGQGDIAEICGLTCLELDLRVVRDVQDGQVPVLRVKGTSLTLYWPESRM